MLLEEALFSHLAAHAGLTALIAGRIYPQVLPQDAVLPAVSYLRVSGPRVHAMHQDPGLQYPRFQIDCWAASYPAAKAVAEQVRLALQNEQNTTWGGAGGVEVQAVFFEGDMDGTFEARPEIYRVITEFIIWAKET